MFHLFEETPVPFIEIVSQKLFVNAISHRRPWNNSWTNFNHFSELCQHVVPIFIRGVDDDLAWINCRELQLICDCCKIGKHKYFWNYCVFCIAHLFSTLYHSKKVNEQLFRALYVSPIVRCWNALLGCIPKSFPPSNKTTTQNSSNSLANSWTCSARNPTMPKIIVFRWLVNEFNILAWLSPNITEP